MHGFLPAGGRSWLSATPRWSSFARAFRAEVGRTPAAYVEALRVERARDLLEDGAQSLESVARAAGFSGPEILRRAFLADGA